MAYLAADLVHVEHLLAVSLIEWDGRRQEVISPVEGKQLRDEPVGEVSSRPWLVSASLGQARGLATNVPHLNWSGARSPDRRSELLLPPGLPCP